MSAVRILERVMTGVVLGAACAVVCATVLTGCATSDDYADSTIADARRRADLRDYDEAQSLLDSALAQLDGDFDLLFEKGEVYPWTIACMVHLPNGMGQTAGKLGRIRKLRWENRFC